MKKFSPKFNEEIYRTVKSFNQRIRRAEARGIKNLPERQKIADLKNRYRTVAGMRKELRKLRKLNTNRAALQTVTLAGGAKITKWELGYLKQSLGEVKTFYDVMIKFARKRYQDYPYNLGLKADLLNIEARREYLDRDINNLTKSELMTIKRYMNKYQSYDKRTNNYYDRYLKGLDEVLKQSGNATLARQLKRKINKLSPQEFAELSKRHDIINDLFETIKSPPTGGKQEVTNEDLDIANQIEIITNNIDEWIEEAKASVNISDLEVDLTPEELEVYKKYYPGA